MKYGKLIKDRLSLIFKMKLIVSFNGILCVNKYNNSFVSNIIEKLQYVKKYLWIYLNNFSLHYLIKYSFLKKNFSCKFQYSQSLIFIYCCFFLFIKLICIIINYKE